MSSITCSSDRADSWREMQVLALLGIEPRLEHEVGHAQHAVHRGADLVAHVRHELALGAAGRFGGLGQLLRTRLSGLDLQ